MSLCKYKNIFGKPNEGIHSYRILNIAIVDLLATILGAYILSFFIKNVNVYIIFIILFLLGQLLHKLFCVETTISKLI